MLDTQKASCVAVGGVLSGSTTPPYATSDSLCAPDGYAGLSDPNDWAASAKKISSCAGADGYTVSLRFTADGSIDPTEYAAMKRNHPGCFK
jgi:hypothetical protein